MGFWSSLCPSGTEEDYHIVIYGFEYPSHDGPSFKQANGGTHITGPLPGLSELIFAELLAWHLVSCHVIPAFVK